MNENDVKKCKKCGATLVGKKSHKLGLCSSCVRELGQGGALLVSGAVFFAFIVSKFIKKR